MKKLFLINALLFSTLVFAKNYRVTITGMTCLSCAEKITKEFSKDQNVEKISVDYAKGLMSLVTKKDAKESDIKKSISDLGYEAIKIETVK